MRKHFLLILLSILLICTTMLFVGCNDTPDNTNENGDGTTQTPSGDNSNGDNTSKFSLSSNLGNCTIEGDKINITAPNSTTSFSFINAFDIPENYKWELHYDKSCLPSLNVVSKSVDLDEGDNTLYALFINKNNSDDIYLYEIVLHRCYDITVSYEVLTVDKSSTFVKCSRKDTISTLSKYELTYIPSENSFERGYSFGGYLDADLNEITQITPRTNTTIYIYQKPCTYKVTFDAAGGNLSNNSLNVTYKSSYILPEPQKAEFKFDGWFIENTNTEVSTSGTWNFPQDVTLVAKWKTIYTEHTIAQADAYTDDVIKGLISSNMFRATVQYQKNENDVNESVITVRCDLVMREYVDIAWNCTGEVKDYDLFVVGKINVKVTYIRTTQTGQRIQETGYFEIQNIEAKAHITYDTYGGILLMFEFKQKDVKAIVEKQGYEFVSVESDAYCTYGAYGTVVYDKIYN